MGGYGRLRGIEKHEERRGDREEEHTGWMGVGVCGWETSLQHLVFTGSLPSKTNPA